MQAPRGHFSQTTTRPGFKRYFLSFLMGSLGQMSYFVQYREILSADTPDAERQNLLNKFPVIFGTNFVCVKKAAQAGVFLSVQLW